MANGIPNPTPKAIVCDLFLPLDDEACDVGDDAADVEKEEFEKAGMTTKFSLTGSVVNLSLLVQQ